MLYEFTKMGYNLDNLKLYESFLFGRINKEYNSTETQIHHILPKFMGGSNHTSNLLKLSLEEHRDAHLILAQCFEENTKEYKGNVFSAQFCQKWIDTGCDELKDKISKIMTGRVVSEDTKRKISKSKKEYINSLQQENIQHPLKGRKLTEERCKKMSEQSMGNTNMLGKYHTEDTKRILREKRSKQIITPESRLKATETRKNNGKLWHTKDGLDRISKARSGVYQGGNKAALLCVDTGVVYNTKKDACERFEISRFVLEKKIREGFFKLLR